MYHPALPSTLRPTLFVAWLLALIATSATARAQSVPGCPDALASWGAACGDGEVRLEVCPAGHAIFAVGPGRVRVDVTRRAEGAFAQAGEIGLSPVGEFASWSEVPSADRAAFDDLVRCARERPAPIVESLDAVPSPPRSGGSDSGIDPSRAPRLPWRILLAGILALALLGRRLGGRGVALGVLPLVALGAATLALRRLRFDEAYFHQNGQGPLWIAHALGEPSSYGPGYAQVFHWAASGAPDPDGAVFLAQGVLAALVPGAAFAIARGAGASRPLAWAAALVIVVSPIHARLALGESYFAACVALLTLAGGVLASCVRPEAGMRSSLIGAGAAGLLIAQAALIHPLCWLAAALLPGVVAVGEGPVSARLKLTLLSTAVIAAVVLATAGHEVLGVLEGPLGAQWLDPDHGGEARQPPSYVLIAAAAAVLGLALTRVARLRRAAIAGVLLAVVIVVCWAGNLLGAAPPWVHHAYRWLFFGAGLAALAALARELEARFAARPVRWLEAGALLAAALTWHAATLDETTPVPTDAREAALWRAWRERLPEGAVVAHLERAGRQIVALPLYHRRNVRFVAGERPADLTAVGRDVFYYRSGLCTTERGRAFCDAIEAEYELEPVYDAVLPALPSMEGLDYDRPEVEVGLYRMKDRRSASTTDEGSSDGRAGR